MLIYLRRFLDGLTVPPPPYSESGDLARDLASGPGRADDARVLQLDDRPRPLAYRRQMLRSVGNGRPTLPPGITIASVNYYPAGGAGLGWHTDSSHDGWRIYIARPLTVLRGQFLTREWQIDDDTEMALAFRIGPGLDSWHAVRAPGPRLSTGLRIVGDAAVRLVWPPGLS